MEYINVAKKQKVKGDEADIMYSTDNEMHGRKERENNMTKRQMDILYYLREQENYVTVSKISNIVRRCTGFLYG